LLLKRDPEDWKWFRVKLSNRNSTLELYSIDLPSHKFIIDLNRYTLQLHGQRQNQYIFSLCPIEGHGTIERFSTLDGMEYNSWIMDLTQHVKLINENYTNWRLSAPTIGLNSSVPGSKIDPGGGRRVLWYPISPRVTDHALEKRKKTMGTRKAMSLKDERTLKERTRHKTETSESLQEMRRSESQNDSLARDPFQVIQDQLERISGCLGNNGVEEYDELMLALHEDEFLAKTAPDRQASRSHNLLNGIIDELVINEKPVIEAAGAAGWIVAEKVGIPLETITTPAEHRKISPTRLELKTEQDEQYHLTKLKKEIC